MRPIYYFHTWSIIWHDIVCWFMVFPPFLPVLVCCDHKIVLHWYKNQNKNNLVIMLRKSLEIVGNLQKSTKNFMSNSGEHIEITVLSDIFSCNKKNYSDCSGKFVNSGINETICWAVCNEKALTQKETRQWQPRHLHHLRPLCIFEILTMFECTRQNLEDWPHRPQCNANHSCMYYYSI